MLTRIFPKFTGARNHSMIFVALIISAWSLLIAWQNSPYAERMGHEMLAGHNHIPFTSLLGTFLLNWLLMTMAMMLPGSLPLLIQSPSGGRANRSAATLQTFVYLSLWMVFGLLAFLGDSYLHEMTETGAPLAAASAFIAPAILLAAGVYQLTPFKRSFTERCKPSKEHDLQTGGAIEHGFRLGLYCIGSCWSLMLLMFALGHHRLDWMIILTGIIAAERLTPWGTKLAKWVGVVLVVWGVFWAAGLL